MTYQMSPEFLDDVRRLIDATRGFLSNDDGNDDEYIMLMGQYVEEVERRLADQADQRKE
jgi:hypothetical protein